MANRYVRSTDGSDADDGTTWALAKATLTGAAAIDVAGDVIWVSQVHAESTAAAISFVWAGTAADPTRVLCGNDGAEPPTALATTATVTTTGTSNITLTGVGYVHYYGITFLCGTGAGNVSIICGTSVGKVDFDSCSFQIVSTGSTSSIIPSSNAAGNISFVNSTFKFAAIGQGLDTSANGARVRITGGAVLSGSSAI